MCGIIVSLSLPSPTHASVGSDTVAPCANAGISIFGIFLPLNTPIALFAPSISALIGDTIATRPACTTALMPSHAVFTIFARLPKAAAKLPVRTLTTNNPRLVRMSNRSPTTRITSCTIVIADFRTDMMLPATCVAISPRTPTITVKTGDTCSIRCTICPTTSHKIERIGIIS